MARDVFRHHQPPFRRHGSWAVGLLAVAAAHVTPVAIGESEPVLGAPAAFGREAETDETVQVDAGTPIHQSAAARAPILRRVDVTADLPLLGRNDQWAQIRFDGLTGWVWTGDARDPTQPPFTTATVTPNVPSMEPPPALRPLAVNEERVNDLVSILGPNRQELRAGRYTLWTDLTDADHVARVVAVLGDVDRAFAARHGIEPTWPEREVVVAFSDPEGYQTATSRVAALSGVTSRGHTRSGIATLIAEGPRRHIDAIVIHETTHLIVRRALGGKLPTWLEEGLAEDLAYTHVDAAGRIDVDRVGRFSSQREALLHGGQRAIQERKVGYAAGLAIVRDDALRDATPSLSELLDFSFEAFVRSDQRNTHYAMAAHFIRYLLDGDDPALRAGFRRYLQQVAAGETANVGALLDALGRDVAMLERGYEAHLGVRLSQ